MVEFENLNDPQAIKEALLNELVVVIRGQDLTPEEEIAFCQSIGKCQGPYRSERSKHIALNDHILRVTGQKNEEGEEGLFGHVDALDWHANQASNKERDPLIWLYGKSGTRGSRTSWIDNKKAYEDLHPTIQESLKKIQITLGYKTVNYSDSKYFRDHHNEEDPFDLVHTNAAGKTGLYFPFLQILGMVGKTEEEFNEIMDMLKEHILQDKYRYDHYWEDGDIVISEQWLSIHKRWKFEDMENRVLHRIAFNYE